MLPLKRDTGAMRWRHDCKTSPYTGLTICNGSREEVLARKIDLDSIQKLYRNCLQLLRRIQFEQGCQVGGKRRIFKFFESAPIKASASL